MGVLFAFSGCPPLVDTPEEFRIQLRMIVLDYLSNPSASDYTKDDIIDLINFYIAAEDSTSIENCEASMVSGHPRIIDILQKSIVFKTECSDALDNDKDG